MWKEGRNTLIELSVFIFWFAGFVEAVFVIGRSVFAEGRAVETVGDDLP
jgi:hypothetical protein